MITKRKRFVLFFMLSVCFCIGFCMFSFPAKTAYAEDNTLYEIKFKCLPSDFEGMGFGWISSDKYIYDEELWLDGHYAKEGEIVTIEVSIDYEEIHSLKRLYYVNASDPSVEVDIDMATKKFIMPAYDITVCAEFNEPTRYTITTSANEGGIVSASKWAYGGERWEIEIYPKEGYRVKYAYYIDSAGDRTDIENVSFQYLSMPYDDVSLFVEFEKIPYSITIPDKVTVKRGEEILTNSDKVYIGDELTITYQELEHHEYTCKIKKDWISSGDTYTVKAEDVDIYYFSEQVEWQVSWQESEKYSISMDRYSEVVANNDWIYYDDDLFFTITSDVSYRITKVLMNGTVLLPDSEGKYNFLMPQETAVITVEGEDLFMMDWTDEDTHSFTIKNGDYVAESPDWFEKGETLKIAVTPKPGYRVTKILANGVIISTSAEATYVMTEENVDFTAEVEKIVYSVIIYEWYANYNGGTKEEFKYVDEQTATVGDTVEILHGYNEKLYSCGDIFYVFLDDPRNFDTDEFYNTYDNYCYSADVWDESGIDFDTMPAENIAVFFELYENSYRFDVPENVSITILESDGIVWETPDVYTNYKDLWINIFSKIKITIEQTDHFITKLYAYNSYFHSDVDSSLYLGDKTEITGVLYDLIESQFDKFITTSDATKLTTTQTQFEWMLDWTDEDTYSFTIKKGDYVAESPDWFEKGETLTITVTPQPGYRVTKILANGVIISTSNQATYTMTEENVDFTAEVEKNQYTITKDSNAQNGNFDISKTTATAGDIITLQNIQADIGYKISEMYYVVDGTTNHILIIDSAFVMPSGNVTVYVKFEKIPYSISIPNGVVVKRGDESLINSDKIYYGDILTIIFNSPEHFETTVKLNNNMIESGSTFTVGVENVVLTYESVQTEWQIGWEESEIYSITIKNGETEILNGTWIASGINLSVTIVPVEPETHEVTSVFINGVSVSLFGNKYTTTKENAIFSAVVEAKNIEIKNDNDHAIIIDDRENIKDTTLEVVIVEEETKEHNEILQKFHSYKNGTEEKTENIKAYTVKLLKGLESVELTANAKLMLLLPDFYKENKTKLYRYTGSSLLEQSFTIKTVGEKRYAMFNSSELGTFAFATFKEADENSEKTVELGIILGAVAGALVAGIAIPVSVVKARKRKKNKE